MQEKWGINTTIIHSDQKQKRAYRAVSTPIVPAVAYAFPDVDTAVASVNGYGEPFYYGRYGNPTNQKLEEKAAELEGGESALAVSSGMAAISIAILHYVTAGDHLLVTKDVYGGTYDFLTTLGPRFGIEFDFVDCTNAMEVEQAIKPNTKALYLETPSNPCLTVLDLKMLTTLAHAHQISVIVDNTFMTPILQRPLDLGADTVVHSATKYMNGHGDVIAGLVISNQKTITFMRKKLMGVLGQQLNAWEAYLILRGLKTIGVRMQRHVENATIVARYLEQHAAIEKVYYPGLPSHPQHELAKNQMHGMGSIVSFELKGGFEAGVQFMNQLKLAIISFSLGDPETLVQHPASMTHSFIPNERLGEFGITSGLIRLSVGLEDPADIVQDLEQALTKVSLSLNG